MVVFPFENDAPLLVDSDAVEVAKVAWKFFHWVAGWYA